MNQLTELLLALFILNLGIAFGAGLYETRIVLPHWFPKSAKTGYRIDLAAMHRLDSGRRFWAFITTAPLTLLTLANLFMAWQTSQPGHVWWLAAALITLVERLLTFTFFIPTIIRLQRADLFTTDRANQVISSWIGVNYIRNGLTLISFCCALIALAH